MKCPFLVRIRQPDYSHKVVYPANCIREKCALWSEEAKQCDPVGFIRLKPWAKDLT